MDKELKVSREAFEEWLDSKPDEEVIDGGLSLSIATTCPIANYIKTIIGEGHSVVVGPRGIVVDKLPYKTPEWVSEFVNDFDHSIGSGAGTVAFAKEILRDVPG